MPSLDGSNPPGSAAFELQSGSGAHVEIRTRDLFLTKEVLYRLSYVGAFSNSLGQLPPELLALSVTSTESEVDPNQDT
jgi:hypothetical protein